MPCGACPSASTIPGCFTSCSPMWAPSGHSLAAAPHAPSDQVHRAVEGCWCWFCRHLTPAVVPNRQESPERWKQAHQATSVHVSTDVQKRSEKESLRNAVSSAGVGRLTAGKMMGRESPGTCTPPTAQKSCQSTHFGKLRLWRSLGGLLYHLQIFYSLQIIFYYIK